MVLPNELTIEDIIPHRDGMLLIDERDFRWRQ